MKSIICIFLLSVVTFVTSSHALYITADNYNGFAGCIVKYTDSGASPIIFDYGFNGTRGVAVGKNNTLYVAVVGDNAKASKGVYVYDQYGTRSLFMSGFSIPHGLTYYNDHLYILDWGAGVISKYNVDTKELVESKSGFNNPHSLAIGLNGELYITDYSSGTIYTCQSLNDPLTVYASGISGACGIVVGTDGNLYVGSDGSNRLLEFTAPFTYTTYASIADPCDVGFTPDDNLLVSSIGSKKLLEYTGSQTTPTVLDSLYGIGPYYMSFDYEGVAASTSVPEPSSMILIMLGLASFRLIKKKTGN